MAGTVGALLEHTYSFKTQNIWINGKKVGEFGIDSIIAAEYNVPTIMASGDDKLCNEAKEWVPDVVTCEVKKSYGCQACKLLSRAKAHRLIEEKTIEAIGKIGSVSLPSIEYPVIMRHELVERTPVGAAPDRKILDCRSYEVETSSVERAFLTG